MGFPRSWCLKPRHRGKPTRMHALPCIRDLNNRWDICKRAMKHTDMYNRGHNTTIAGLKAEASWQLGGAISCNPGVGSQRQRRQQTGIAEQQGVRHNHHAWFASLTVLLLVSGQA